VNLLNVINPLFPKNFWMNSQRDIKESSLKRNLLCHADPAFLDKLMEASVRTKQSKERTRDR